MTFRRQDHIKSGLLGGLFIALCSLSVGCEETAHIRVQDVPKQVIEPDEFAGMHEQPHTILAAMVPHEKEVWVFRLDGPSEDVQSQREAFESFIGSLSFTEGQSRPRWTLPDDWEESAAPPSSLREASIRVPLEGSTALDLSVSRLPSGEDWFHYRLRNFNRWRRQLQLPVAGADQLQEASTTVAVENPADRSASVLAISGKFSEAELARMASRNLLSRTSAASAATSAAAAGRSDGLIYETPAGWDEGPPSSMRRASLVIADGEQKADVAVFSFPLGNSAMGDPLANLNRWRGQVGLASLEADEIEAHTERIEVDGDQGLYAALNGENAGVGRAMRVAMVQRGDQVWFFKLDGPQELVERETERFREFIRSVQFPDP